MCFVLTRSGGRSGCSTSSHFSRRRHNGELNRSPDWLHQEQADLEDRLRILDALYIPTRYPDRLPIGPPPTITAAQNPDAYGRLQSEAAHRYGHRPATGQPLVVAQVAISRLGEPRQLLLL